MSANADDFEERVITVPLRDAKAAPSTERADAAMRVVREHVARQFGVPEDAVRIDPSLNEHVWDRGRSSPPNDCRVLAAKFVEAGTPVVEVEPAD